jgi:tRNA threonylcarbamoyladenosine biosynthesis protein TsaB
LAEIAVFLIEEPCAGDALALVMRRVEADDYDDVAAVDANYLRRTDAEIFAKPNAARQPGISVS